MAKASDGSIVWAASDSKTGSVDCRLPRIVSWPDFGPEPMLATPQRASVGALEGPASVRRAPNSPLRFPPCFPRGPRRARPVKAGVRLQPRSRSNKVRVLPTDRQRSRQWRFPTASLSTRTTRTIRLMVPSCRVGPVSVGTLYHSARRFELITSSRCVRCADMDTGRVSYLCDNRLSVAWRRQKPVAGPYIATLQ